MRDRVRAVQRDVVAKKRTVDALRRAHERKRHNGRYQFGCGTCEYFDRRSDEIDAGFADAEPDREG